LLASCSVSVISSEGVQQPEGGAAQATLLVVHPTAHPVGGADQPHQALLQPREVVTAVVQPTGAQEFESTHPDGVVRRTALADEEVHQRHADVVVDPVRHAQLTGPGALDVDLAATDVERVLPVQRRRRQPRLNADQRELPEVQLVETPDGRDIATLGRLVDWHLQSLPFFAAVAACSCLLFFLKEKNKRSVVNNSAQRRRVPEGSDGLFSPEGTGLSPQRYRGKGTVFPQSHRNGGRLTPRSYREFPPKVPGTSTLSGV
jgi:hypothetical protein